MVAASVEASERHDEWYRCERDEQCVIVRSGCGVEWAANKDFAEKSHEGRGYYACGKPMEVHPENTVAKCENSQCILCPPGFYAGGYKIVPNH